MNLPTLKRGEIITYNGKKYTVAIDESRSEYVFVGAKRVRKKISDVEPLINKSIIIVT